MGTIKGLEGVIATESSVSSIIDDQLTYAGYRLDDLVNGANFEEVIFLLWHLRLPNASELSLFQKELARNMDLPDEIICHLKSYNHTQVHPMAALRTAVSFLAVFDDEADILEEEANLRKAIRIQAKICAVVAAFSRIRQGKEPVKARPDLNYAENFLYMLNGKEAEPVAVDVINKALIIHADHELNASTFTARVCVATLSDIYSGITAAIGALKGSLHGGANESVMEMLLEIDTIENAVPYIQRKLSRGEKIMGIGHRVYKDGDPRAVYLEEMARELTRKTGREKWYNISVEIEKVMKKEKGLLANVDFYSASVYHCLGIEHDLFTPIFAVSRVSGWIAHILEQYDNNRLIRPRAKYIGPKGREFISLEKRE